MGRRKRSRRPVEPERKAERGECTGALRTYSVQKIIIMAYRFFTIAIRAPEAAQAELNGFLRSHRVLVVERRWVDQGENSLWIEARGAGPSIGVPRTP